MAERKRPAANKGGGANRPAPPSVEDQLAASKVVHGSALEQLIRDNQDFNVLRPEEVGDDLGVPLWLRVYWRKHHPDEQYSTVDPTGGFPDVLSNIYRWMLLHQDLPWGSQTDPVGTPPAPSGGTDAGGHDRQGGAS